MDGGDFIFYLKITFAHKPQHVYRFEIVHSWKQHMNNAEEMHHIAVRALFWNTRCMNSSRFGMVSFDQ